MKRQSFYECAKCLREEAVEFILNRVKGVPGNRVVFYHLKDVTYFSEENGVMDGQPGAIDSDGIVYFLECDSDDYPKEYDFDGDPDGIVGAHASIKNVDWMNLCEIADFFSSSNMFSCRMKGIVMDALDVVGALEHNTKVDGLSVAMQVDDHFYEVPVVLVSKKGFTIVDPDYGSVCSYDELMTDDLLWLLDEINLKFSKPKK